MKIAQIKIVGFLIFTIACFSFNFGFSAAAAQEETERSRIAGKPTPKKTPTVEPTKTLTPTPAPVQTLADLQSQIRATLARPELQRGSIGVKIASLDTNAVVFEENAERYFMPASNMKSFTVAAAIEKLSPDFKFVTSVYASAKPDANGTIKGDLSVYGRGDVSFSTAFSSGDYYKNLDALAERIKAAGVKRIEGNLVGDESYFSGNPVPESWEWNDLQWYYGAEITALPINDNAVDLFIKPGSLNQPCAVQVLPANAIMKIVNRCVTTAAGTKREPQVFKPLDQNTVEVGGTMPIGKDYAGYIAVSRPARLFIEMLHGLLVQKGVVINGQNKIVNAKDKESLAVATMTPPVEIARLESPPLSVIAAQTLKPSQNTYTETILWTLGEQTRINPNIVFGSPDANALRDPKLTSAQRGLSVVRFFLNEIGIAPDGVIQYDGSGLSRRNLITPASAVRLFTFMSKSRYAGAWRDALTIGAVDGTLKNRFVGTVAAANARGKTGTFDQVSSLSGYVSSASGEQLVFSIIINGVVETRLRQSAIDEIVVALAKFNGRTN